MKKKILSTLLAVCLFVGMAVPAVMAATSDRAGDAKKVNKIVAKKDAYTIEVNSAGKDFAGEVLIFENESKLVLDQQHIRYELYGASGDYGAFSIKGSTVTAHKAGAEATLTIYDNYNANSNARVTVKLTSAYGAQGTNWKAETFTFDASSIDLPLQGVAGSTGAAEDVSFVVKSHPAGRPFGFATADLLGDVKCDDPLLNGADLNSTVEKELVAFLNAWDAEGSTWGPAGIAYAYVADTNNSQIKITLNKAGLTNDAFDTVANAAAVTVDGIANIGNAVRAKTKADLNRSYAFNIQGIERLDAMSVPFSAAINFRPVPTIDAVAVAFDQNEYTVTVGEEVEPKLNYYPPNANVGMGKFSWDIASYDYTGRPYQYATKNGGKILGVDATDLAKSRIVIMNGANAVGASSVTVKPYAFLDKVTPYVNIESSEITVGTGVTIEVKNLPAGVTVKSWSVKQDGTVVDLQKWDTTNPNRVEGKKVGTATVSATLTNGETYNVNVTVKAAPAAEKPAGGATSNPQTGDSLFANLF